MIWGLGRVFCIARAFIDTGIDSHWIQPHLFLNNLFGRFHTPWAMAVLTACYFDMK